MDARSAVPNAVRDEQPSPVASNRPALKPLRSNLPGRRPARTISQHLLPIRACSRYTQIAYIVRMKAVFIELPAFERHRQSYLDDEGFRQLQIALLANPEAGDVIEGTGGSEFWLFTLYDKDEASDLTPVQRASLKERLKGELKLRRQP